VILLDLHLPGMDGLAFVRLLKANPGTREIPVPSPLRPTPSGSPGVNCLRPAATPAIVKPIDTRQLSRELEDAAEKKAR
jgi:CheY-like chemotaxis protein